MRLAELHEVVYGNGYDLYCVKGFGDDPEAIAHFGYDDNKPIEYMDCVVVGIEVESGVLCVTVHCD